MHTDYLKYVQRCRKKIQSGVAILQIKVMAISILHIMTYQHWQLTVIKAEGTAQHSLQASIVAMSVHVNDDPYLIFHSKSGEAHAGCSCRCGSDAAEYVDCSPAKGVENGVHLGL